MPEPLRARGGPGRVLALAYAFFTLAAGARSAVQLSQHPHDALLAYVLSAVSAGIYASGAVLVAGAERGRWQRAALVSCLVEVAGVLVVGTLGLVRPAWFGEASVWSGYGSGYGWVPAVLPLLALWWLWSLRTSPPERARDAGDTGLTTPGPGCARLPARSSLGGVQTPGHIFGQSSHSPPWKRRLRPWPSHPREHPPPEDLPAAPGSAPRNR